jgi:uncharacterized membrane protein
MARAARARHLSPRRLLWAAIAAYAAGFTALSALRHRAFETGRFDLGNMVQALWSTAHGRPLQMTDLAGDQVSRLGSHVDPLLALFAPLWWVWPRPELLLTAQAIAVSLGALPVFWLAEKHLHSRTAALGLGLAYLLYPPIEWATLSEFHPVVLSCPLLLFAIWFIDEERLGLFVLFAVLAALGKEEIGLVVAGIGIWYGVSHRRPGVGAAIAIAGVVATFVAVDVIVPHFHEGASPFLGRYRAVGGSPGGIAKNLVTDPGVVLGAAFDERGVRYLLALVLPLAALSLAAPLALVIAAPEIALNLLSSVTTQTSVEQHYAAGATPGLIVAAIFGAARLSRGRPDRARLLGAVAVAAAIVANVHLGALPVWAGRPAALVAVSSHDDAARRVLGKVPRGVPVSATNTLGAHLSDRRRILSFPKTDGVDWVVVDRTRPTVLDKASPGAAGDRAVVALERNPRWRLVAADNGVELFVRAGSPAARGTPTAQP